MARKLAISNKVLVPVTVILANAAGRNETFKFHLVCERQESEALRKSMTDEKLSAVDFLHEVVTGWDGQKLVLEDDGTPSPFSREALDDMLSIPGVAALISRAYVLEVTAKEKN